MISEIAKHDRKKAHRRAALGLGENRATIAEICAVDFITEDHNAVAHGAAKIGNKMRENEQKSKQNKGNSQASYLQSFSERRRRTISSSVRLKPFLSALTIISSTGPLALRIAFFTAFEKMFFGRCCSRYVDVNEPECPSQTAKNATGAKWYNEYTDIVKSGEAGD